MLEEFKVVSIACYWSTWSPSLHKHVKEFIKTNRKFFFLNFFFRHFFNLLLKDAFSRTQFFALPFPKTIEKKVFSVSFRFLCRPQKFYEKQSHPTCRLSERITIIFIDDRVALSSSYYFFRHFRLAPITVMLDPVISDDSVANKKAKNFSSLWLPRRFKPKILSTSWSDWRIIFRNFFHLSLNFSACAESLSATENARVLDFHPSNALAFKTVEDDFFFANIISIKNYEILGKFIQKI